jgi:hypothetical protein
MRDQLQAILDDPYSTAHERAMAQAKLRDAGEQPSESDALQVLLRACGKKHLRDVSWPEFQRHSARLTWMEKLQLDYLRGQCPDDELLAMMGYTTQTWEGRAKTSDVRANAEQQINQLAGGDGH